ncbi:hypothetical protein L6R53_15460 [Myxococcota bacterium]|nr:hypothetical protein [Myxococcota bacterium]
MSALRTLLALLGLSGLGGAAHAAEYRRITLNDGRVLVAEVESTTATGLELAMPQGRATVRFDQVQSLEEVDQATWKAQPSWTVVVLPPAEADAALAPTLAQQLAEAVAQVPAVVVTTPDKMTRLSATQRTAFAACGTDAACIQGYLDLTGARVAVSARLEGDPSTPNLVVVSSFAQAPLARREVSVDWATDASAMRGPLRQTVETALHLKARPVDRNLPRTPSAPAATTPAADPSPTAPVAAAPTSTAPASPSPAGPSPSTLRALSWVPLPGLPSMARGDWGGAGASLAIAIPGTVGMVAVAGQASFTQGQLIATSAGSYYLLTVAVNKAFGLRGLPAPVSVVPVQGGGAVAVIHGELGGVRARGSR